MTQRMSSAEYRQLVGIDTPPKASQINDKKKIVVNIDKLSSTEKKIDSSGNKRPVKILAIDPGNEQSAWAIIDTITYQPLVIRKDLNARLLYLIDTLVDEEENFYCAIEMIASYGMAVGKEVFDTCVWIGRFKEALKRSYCQCDYVYRKDVKINLCQSMKAKDANIRQALIDRFGVVGTKNNKGWFYGFAADIWSAYAVGVTYIDRNKGVTEWK